MSTSDQSGDSSNPLQVCLFFPSWRAVSRLQTRQEQDIIDQYNSKLGAVGTQSVLIQLGLMLGLSLAMIVLFSVLRPKNKIVYAPKWKYSSEKHRPPPVEDGLLSW
jgi:hypothetical protein